MSNPYKSNVVGRIKKKSVKKKRLLKKSKSTRVNIRNL